MNYSWAENYGANAVQNGPNISLSLSEAATVKFYYDHKSHCITDNINSVIATVAGSFQSELGNSSDWDPAGLRSWLQDPDGNGIYEFSCSLPPGDYECKVAIDEAWLENYGAGGIQNGPNIPFSVIAGDLTRFIYDPLTHLLSIERVSGPTIGWCNLQWPSTMSIKANKLSDPFFGQVWIDGITSEPGPSEGLTAEFGYGPQGSDPYSNDWIWYPALFYTDSGNNEEYRARMIFPDEGVYDYCFRYTYNFGEPVLGDLYGPVASGEPLNSPGTLTVTPSDWIIEKSVSPLTQTIIAGHEAEFEWVVKVTKNAPDAPPATLDDDVSPMFPITVTDSATFTYKGSYTSSSDIADYSPDGSYTYTSSNTARLMWPDSLASATAETEVVCVLSPEIEIVKVTTDSTTSGDGLTILRGEQLKWYYCVTNKGILPLVNISLVDDKLSMLPQYTSGDDGDMVLAPDSSETWVFEAYGTASAGPYENTAQVYSEYVDSEGDMLSPATDSDSSSYFGADPKIGIIKNTADEYGNKGDVVGILTGDKVTWIYDVANEGNVPLGCVLVTDNIPGIDPAYSSGDDGDGIFEPGEVWIFKAEGTATGGLHSNTGTAAGEFTDSAGHTRHVESSDTSSYFGLDAGYVTNSSLCEFGDEFKIIFTPDVKNWPGTFKLSGENPGQFYYNLFFNAGGHGGMIDVSIPYPFVTQGSVPVHAYGGVFVDMGTSGACFKPVSAAGSITAAISSDQRTLHISGLPESGFLFVTIHLDLGLEGTTGWKKGKQDAALYDRTNFDPDYPDIPDGSEFEFESPDIPGSSFSIINDNLFKNLKGFGGMVTDGVSCGISGLSVLLSSSEGKVLETMVTDANGWYFSRYVHKGKAADYSLKLLSTGEIILLHDIGGAVKYGEGNFIID